jgi:hypothetical protein
MNMPNDFFAKRLASMEEQRIDDWPLSKKNKLLRHT